MLEIFNVCNAQLPVGLCFSTTTVAIDDMMDTICRCGIGLSIK